MDKKRNISFLIALIFLRWILEVYQLLLQEPDKAELERPEWNLHL